MSSAHSGPHSWIISDGAAGNARQAMALAQALDLSPREVTVKLRHPWDWLAPRLTWQARHALCGPQGQLITPPWPDIAIGCGRQAALLTRCLRRWSKGRCFTVQILDPRVSPGLFDALVVPQHDGVCGPSVVTTLGAVHGIDVPWWPKHASVCAFCRIPAPRVGVLIGASIRHRHWTTPISTLAAHTWPHGTSATAAVFWSVPQGVLRRHGATSAQCICARARHSGGRRRWRESLSRNSGLGRTHMVSADSVNMISEACATGKPVHAFAPKPILGKLGRFHQELTHAGYLSPWGDESSPVPEPLRELPEVARKVRLLWKAFQRNGAADAWAGF